MGMILFISIVVLLCLSICVCEENRKNNLLHRFRRQAYGNQAYGNTAFLNNGYGWNPDPEYYHRLWDQMHAPIDPAFGAPPPMDPMDPAFAAPPPMDPAFAAPPPMDPAFEEWAHRMGWIAEPPPPADPALEDYIHRSLWGMEHLPFDPAIESELFHGFGFMPAGWAYEHFYPIQQNTYG